MPQTLLVAGSQPLVIEGVADRLAQVPGFLIQGVVTTADDVLAALRGDHPPDLLLFVEALAGGNEAELVEALHSRPSLKVAAVVEGPCSVPIDLARSLGTTGFLRKADHLHDLIPMLQAVLSGATVSSTPLPPASRVPISEPRLSPRERQILQDLSDGISPRDLCRQLTISEKTLRNHIHNAISKLGVHSQLQAVSLGLRSGWLRPPGQRLSS